MLAILSIAYISVQLISLSLSWPQLHKLFVMKESDEMSLTTWMSWTAAQTVTTLYAAASHQILWFSMSVVWLAFDIAMVVLIYKYRPRYTLQVAEEAVADK